MITNETARGNDLIVEYYVRATYNSEKSIVPQVAVEATLTEYRENITQDLGVEVTNLSLTFAKTLTQKKKNTAVVLNLK